MSAAPTSANPARPKLALAGTFTLEPLAPSLELVLASIGLELDVEVTPYAQVFQELLDPGRSFARNRGGVNVVLVRLEDWWGHAPPEGPVPLPPEETLARPIDDLVASLRQASGSSPAPIVVMVCPPSPRWTRDPARRARHDALERRLADALAGLRAVRLAPRPAVSADDEEAARDVHDEEGDRLGHVPYRPLYFAALALSVARTARTLMSPPRKVLALDCDNTLWKGVVGEEGVAGIQIGARERTLQDFALAKKREGMLLCLVSKNVPEDVDAVLAERADMRLRAGDLAATRVNWLPKSQNLHDLAAELNLGLDSFVFVDDNPIECAEVAAACPGVLTVPVPEATAADDEAAGREMAAFLAGLWPLDHLDITDEDRRRTELYRENRERTKLRESATSLADFLAGLELRVGITDVRPEQRARAAQLTQRTNQFNFTTKRRNEAEIERLGDDGKACLVVEARDRFGDYGLVGLMIVGVAGDAVEAETMLLSCRILGRGVETQMVQELGKIALARGLSKVALPFAPTAKNLPALRFLETLPAEKLETPAGPRYVLSADAAAALVYAPSVGAGGAPEELADEPTKSGATTPTRAEAVPASPAQWARFARELSTPAGLVAALGRERRARAIGGAPKPPRTATERALAAIWADVLRLPEVGVADDFFELGGTSLDAVSVFARIAREMGRRLPLTTLIEQPTIEAVAARLDAPEEHQSLVLLQGGGEGPPLFLVHDADGETLLYRNLARRLAGEHPVYALQPRLRADSSVVHTSIADMAAHYVAEIRRVHPDGPYLLGGLCAGGILAFEMARQLEQAGQAAHLVAVFDAADVEAQRRPALAAQRTLARFTDAVRAASPLEVPKVVASKVVGHLSYQVKSRARGAYERAAVATLGACLERDLPAPSWARALPVRVVYSQAEARYRPAGKVRDEIVLFCATAGEGAEEPFRALYVDPLLGWQQRTEKGVVSFEVPGGHGSILQEPNVAVLADHLRARMARFRSPNGTSSMGGGNGAVAANGDGDLPHPVVTSYAAPQNGAKLAIALGNNLEPGRSPDVMSPAALDSAPSFLDLLKEDFETHDRDASEPGFWAVATHRIGVRALDANRPRAERAVLDVVYRAMFRSVDLVWGIHLPRTTELGRRVRLWHNGCMLLTAKSIGSDVHLRHDTTFGPLQTGPRRPQQLSDLPVIEDGVDIGSGACVMGDVRVGRGAMIGANSVVLKNVPAGAVVLGVPARIVPK
jgi:FkbH-like protein